MSNYAVVIPARYASERLPGKPLRDIGGKPMIEHVYERAKESRAAEVIIATDDQRIADAASGFGADVCMTAVEHSSGSERLAEVCTLRDWAADRIVINLQGDEPLMPAELIDQCAALLDDPIVDIATLASPLQSLEDFRNPNVVKAVCADNGNALYFSRAAVPHPREADAEYKAMQAALHHHGIYGYRVSILQQLVAARPSPLETCERLEQLRALSLGMTIRVGVPATRPGPGVDTEADLADVARLIAG